MNTVLLATASRDLGMTPSDCNRVIADQPETYIFANPYDQLVIRQRSWPDEDAWVRIAPEHLPAVIERLCHVSGEAVTLAVIERLCGTASLAAPDQQKLEVVPAAPRRRRCDPSAAERMRPYRASQLFLKTGTFELDLTSAFEIAYHGRLLFVRSGPRGRSKRRMRRWRCCTLPLTVTLAATFPGAVIATATVSSGSGGSGRGAAVGLIQATSSSLSPAKLLRSTLVSSMPSSSPLSLYCQSVQFS
jgi:hypothetical protein